MLVLGIDPGIACTGFGLLEENDRRPSMIDYGCIVTDKDQPAEERLQELYQEIFRLIQKAEPNQVAIEKLFFSKNTSSAMIVSQARGVIMLAAAESNIPVAEYAPLEVKMALTGYGRADKRQIQQMVKTLLGLSEIPKPDHAADALAIAICHLNSYKIKSLDKL
ncbi:MAG: crossover junction endodeoxyribonuclease RuvC [Candidatus Saganbacteria bacterium]|nr:crossover junction endodeoxyribonuclease RuvC [Candidatus Saganbacteria bacterium]